MPTTAATLAQGDLEVEAGRRAALGGVVDEQGVRRRNEDDHPVRRHYRPALGRQGCSPGTAKTVTAAAQVS